MTGLWVGLAGWAIASGGLLVAALLVARRCRTGVPRLDVLAVGFLWTFLTTLLVLVLGLLGMLRPRPALAAVVIALLTAAAATGRREATGILWAAGAALAGLLRDLRRALRAHPALVGGALALATLQTLRIAVHVWVLPPYIWDALSYHLPHVAEWIQRGEVRLFETPAVTTRWPANHELLQTWFALFPHHDVLVDAASVPAYLLAIGATYAIARRLGAPRGLAGFAAVAYAYTPAVALHAATVNNDLPIAAAYLLVMALLLHLNDRQVRVGPVLLLSGLVLSLALGTKAYIVFLVPGLLLVAWSAFRARHRPGAPAHPLAAGPSRAPALPVALIAGGLLLGGYWYARNWMVFGNPFSPTDFRLFGHLVLGTGDGIGQQGTFSLAGLARNLYMLRGKVQDTGPFQADLTGIAGWGWFAIGVGIPALAYGLARRPVLRWVAGAFGVSLLSLLSWVTPDWWNLRFALWFPALFAVGFAVAVDETRSAVVRRGLLGLATAALLLNLAGTLTVADLTPPQWRALLAFPVTERSAAALQAVLAGRIGGSYLRAIERVPRTEALGYHLPPVGAIYPLYGADLSRRLRYLPIEAGTHLGETMDRREVRHLFVWRPGPGARVAIERAVASHELVRVDEGLYARAP